MKAIFFPLCMLVAGPFFGQQLAKQPGVNDQPGAVFAFAHHTVFFSTDFAGARLNQIEAINDSIFNGTIVPENNPINRSPWFAFKIWAATPRTIQLNLHITVGTYRHPQLSHDGKHWEVIPDSLEQVADDRKSGTLTLSIGPDTLWVSRAELYTAAMNEAWMDSLVHASKIITKEPVGRSVQGRPINALHIARKETKQLLVILSRQHPPELSGYFAMQAFVTRLAGPSKLAKSFQRKFEILVIPMINPDGVDLGHYRHNAHGVDLNRDWEGFKQPETQAVRDLLLKKVNTEGDSLWFAVDFHSTSHDVCYVVTDDTTSLTVRWLTALNQAEGVKGMPFEFHGVKRATSKNWIYNALGAEAVTYEVGASTDRDYLRKVSQQAADLLMNLLLEGLEGKPEKAR